MHTGQQRRFPAVPIAAVLFLLCIIPGQFWIAKLVPDIAGLVQINPSLVFLDIPIHFPVAIDLILAPGLFLLVYPLVILIYPSRTGIPSWRQAVQRTRSAFAGLFILLFCVLSGGLIYYLVQDELSRRVRNGINSFGINTDIYLPYPGYETIHLRGSTILFVCFVTGMWICLRKIRKEPGMQKAGQLTREQRMTPYERMMQEKRMKEKQVMQEVQPIQHTQHKKKGHKADKISQPAPQAGKHPYQETTRPYRNDPTGLCCRQPVRTFRPEAVSYMPMS